MDTKKDPGNPVSRISWVVSRTNESSEEAFALRTHSTSHGFARTNHSITGNSFAVENIAVDTSNIATERSTILSKELAHRLTTVLVRAELERLFVEDESHSGELVLSADLLEERHNFYLTNKGQS
jgi:hypothetical protein